MRIRVKFLIVALICLFVEFAAVGTLVYTQMPKHVLWFRHLVTALQTGQEIAPANNGPYDYRMFRSVAGMAARHGAAAVYQPVRLHRFEERARMQSGSWIYAPTVIPLTMFARLSDFGRGFLIWTALLTLVSVLVLWRASIPWPVIAATLVSPATIWNLYLGQLGLISGALFIAALVWTAKRPVAGGIAAGLLTLKPQAGLLLPVVFLARGRYRSILLAIVTFAALVVLSLILYGSGVWIAYLHDGLATARDILIAPFPTIYQGWGISVFWMARGFGCGVTASYVVQTTGAAVAIIWCWLAWRDPEAAILPRIALTTCLTTFVTPYGYIDDLCAFSLGIALLAWHRGGVRPADLLLWAWPSVAFLSVAALHVLITPLVILLAAIRAQVEMKRDAPGRQRIEEVLRDVAAPPG